MEPIAASINDTAKALSLGRTSIYALIREGKLETLKLGRRTLVRVDSIRRLLDRQ
jgi:excisionase family DNA binding protein